MEKLIIVGEAIYVLVVAVVTCVIIYDTRTPTKTLGYLLLVIFVPVFGIVFYFSFGVNYRKRKLYDKKIVGNDAVFESVKKTVLDLSYREMEQKKELLDDKADLTRMIFSESWSPLLPVTDMKLLVNGEAKFPEVLNVLEKARDHIHIEYYIYADDEIGNRIKDILI